jgi:hypothetical protein
MLSALVHLTPFLKAYSISDSYIKKANDFDTIRKNYKFRVATQF